VLDLGKRWFEKTELPIPLGLDVVSRKLGDEMCQKVADALKASIVYAHKHEDEALDYALGFGRGIAREDGRKFVRMYVNKDTVDMGEEGREALETLFGLAAARDIIAAVPELDLVQAR
jgi:1,4-dihydroxy-6-naphthoate synthase